ncbi:TetR/AcrR family transcriptional regulator [Caulobacter sp. KR2-114]|uniref:TetR/AcrR family transcriptional regulator n=1 Tax=Caulobacter sp. KR2-114 TaxID=3400912 RepID=UPI003C10BE9D
MTDAKADGPPARTRARSAEDREAMRERLCQVAARLFVDQGEAAFSMRALAAEVGCSPMAAYRYFETKEDLLAAVRARAFRRLAEALESVAEGERRKARDIGEAYVRFADENPAEYRLMFDLTQPDEGRYPDLAEAAAAARIGMSRYVREMVEAGVLEGDPELLGYVFWATIHGLIVLRLAGRLPKEPGFEVLRRTALGALMKGFRAGR